MVASHDIHCDFFARNLNYASAIMSDHLLDQLDSKQSIAQINKTAHVILGQLPPTIVAVK